MGLYDGRGLSMLPLDGEISKLSAILNEVESIALEQLPVGAGAARGPGTRDGWISGFANTRLVEWDHNLEGIARNDLIRFPAIASAVGALMKKRGAVSLYQVMVNRLDPAGALDVHRDGRPFEPTPERWHLPVISNPMVEYWEERLDGPLHMSIGSWWGPIEYWTLHRMTNLGETPRIHLVADLIVG